MIGWLGTALIVGALVVAGLAGVSALRRRGPYLVAVAVAVIVEVMLVVQAVVAVAVAAYGRQTPDEPGLFFSYLVACTAVLPVSVLLARAERTQFGSLVILVGGMVLAVLVVRLQQLWGVAVG